MRERSPEINALLISCEEEIERTNAEETALQIRACNEWWEGRTLAEKIAAMVLIEG